MSEQRPNSLEALKFRAQRLDSSKAKLSALSLNVKPILETRLSERLGKGKVLSADFFAEVEKIPQQVTRIVERIHLVNLPAVEAISNTVNQQIAVQGEVARAKESFDRIMSNPESSDVIKTAAKNALDDIMRNAGIEVNSVNQAKPEVKPLVQKTEITQSKPVIKIEAITQSEEVENDWPLIKIDIDNKRLEGQPHRVRGSIGWKVALLFAANPGKEVTASQILERSRNAGSQSNDIGNMVRDARYVLGDSIKTVVSRGPNTRYKLEAKVEFTPSKMIIDEEKRLVEFRGKRFQLTENQFPVFAELIKNLNQEVPTQQLLALFPEGTTDTRTRTAFRGLASYFNMPDSPAIFTNKMAASKSSYKLSGVAPTWSEIDTKLKRIRMIGRVNQTPIANEIRAKAEWSVHPVSQENLSALNLFVSNPDITGEQFMEVILKGREGKQGRKPTHNSTWLNLVRSAQYLVLRQEAGIIEEQELPTVSLLQHAFTENGFETVDEFSEYVHGKLFPNEDFIKSEDEIAPNQVLEKSAVLATLFLLNRDLLNTLNIDTSYVEDMARNLVEKMKHKKIKVDNIADFRANLFDPENVESFKEIFENIDDEDVQMLAITLKEFLDTASESARKSLLNGGNLAWQERHAQILTSWREWDLEGETIVAEFQSQSEEEPELIQMIDEIAPDVLAEDSIEEIKEEIEDVIEQEVFQAPQHAIPEATTYVSALERRDPEVKVKISALVSDVLKELPFEVASQRQVSRAFNSLTRAELEKMIEKRYVAPSIHDSPEFSRADIALMLYIKKFGNGLNKKQIRELRTITNQELIKQINLANS